MITLLIKASLILIVLLAFYKLFLEKESFFAANRIYLIGCLLFAATLPFLGLPELVHNQGIVTTLLEPSLETDPVFTAKAVPSVEKPPDNQEDQGINTTKMAPENAILSKGQNKLSNPTETYAVQPTPADQATTKSQAATQRFSYWLVMLYYFGVMGLSLKLLVQIFYTVWKIYKIEDKIPDEDSVLVNMKGDIDPCSFFKYIFINPASYDYETYEQIIAHERIHVRLWHTLDLLLSEIAVIALWFNPFVWILRKEVEKNIEYQTDDLMVREDTAGKDTG